MFKTCLFAAAALVATGATVVAADSSKPLGSWTGVYLGGHLGYGSIDTDWTNRAIHPFSALGGAGPITVPVEAFSAEDVVAGVQAGGNYQFGPLVAGVEVAYTATGLDDTKPISAGAFITPAQGTLTSSLDSLITVTGRLGYAFDPRWMAYVKGGYAHAKVGIKGVDTSVNGYNFSDAEWTGGWTVGGGVEVRLSSSVSLAFEYARIDLDDVTITAQTANLPAFPASASVKNEIDTATVRLNVKLY